MRFDIGLSHRLGGNECKNSKAKEGTKDLYSSSVEVSLTPNPGHRREIRGEIRIGVKGPEQWCKR